MGEGGLKTYLVREFFKAQKCHFLHVTGTQNGSPKQREWALVPMPQLLAEFMEAAGRHKFTGDFAAPAAQGGMLEYKKFYNGLRELCDHAGIKGVSPHKLRHSCTELWFLSGATLEDIRRLLNHKSSTTTERYVHRSDTRLLGLAKGMTGALVSGF